MLWFLLGIMYLMSSLYIVAWIEKHELVYKLKYAVELLHMVCRIVDSVI